MSTQPGGRRAAPGRKALYIVLGAVALFLAAGTAVVLWPGPFVSVQSVQVIAPERVTIGESAGIDVCVADRAGGRPIADAEISLEARSGAGGAWTSRQEKSDQGGRVRFTIPTAGGEALPFMAYHLRVKSGLGSDFVHGRILMDRASAVGALPEPAGIYIVTDKPIYQPGQVIHYSVFVTAPGSLAPRPGVEATVEIRDSRDNVIERKTARTSAHGNVSGQLAIAAEALTGQYRLTVTSGRERAEKPLAVKRYVRRRMRLAVAFAKPYATAEDGAAAEVRAEYFSGSAAANVDVRLKLSRDEGVGFETALAARTDAAGVARVEFPSLRDALRPAEDWATLAAALEADDGGTPESWQGQLTLYRRDVRVELLPEGGTVLPAEENRFVLAAYRADGRPAPGKYTVNFGGAQKVVTVGEAGFAEFALRAPAAAAEAVISWRDDRGGKAQERAAFKALERNAVRLAAAPKPPKPGGDLDLTVAVRRDLLEHVDELRLTLASPRGVAAQKTLSRLPAAPQSVSLPLPPDIGQKAVVLAFLRTRGRGTYTARVEVPVAGAAGPRLKIAATKSKLLPGEETELHLGLADGSGSPVGGAAALVVTDASILARAGGVTPEDELAGWLAGLSAKLDLPPAVASAYLDGKGLSFLPLRYVPPAVKVGSNARRLAVEDRRRSTAWWNLVRAALISLTAGWLVFRAGRFLRESGRLLSALLVILVVLMIFAIAVPSLLAARRSSLESGGPPMSEADIRRAMALAQPGQAAGPAAGAPLAVRAREYFPETLLFLPEVALDERGEARVPLKLADNVTAWHASAVGVADRGGLAGAGTELLATKPFFIEPDFPVAFIEGDEPVLRVAAFNRAPGAQAEVRLEPGEFYACPAPVRSLALARDGRALLEFPVRFTKSGRFRLRVRAACGGNADEVLLPVEVTPHGREVTASAGGRLAAGEAAAAELPLPREAVLRSYVLRVHPTPLAEYLGGIEGLLGQPHGCFEQTTSINYPNLMVLEYLRSAGRLNPELEGRAREFLKQGYQRLLSFEVNGGGFSLFGHAPAEAWLSAYGLMQFHDMSKVLPVDPAVMQRTWEFLRTRLDRADSRTRSYAVWAALRAGYRDEWIARHVKTLERSVRDDLGAYEQALVLNACLEHDPASAECRGAAARLAQRLLAEKDDAADYRTLSSAYGRGARVETLALAAMALSRAGTGAELQGQLLRRIARMRSPGGAWPGTQATVLALQAVAAAGTAPDGVAGEIAVRGSGVALGRLTLDGRSAAPQFLEFSAPPADAVAVEFRGRGSVSYALLARGQLRWGAEEQDTGRRGLNLRLEVPEGPCSAGQELPLAAVLQDRGDGAENCMLEIGLGPALVPNETALDALVKSGAIQRHETVGNRLVLYLGGLAAGAEKRLDLRLVAGREGRFQLPPARAYEYYRPENMAVIPGKTIVVKPGGR